MIRPFPWCKLTSLSRFEHCVTDDQRIAVFGNDEPPFAIPAGFCWDHGGEHAWCLRTTGAPSTMTRLHTAFGELVRNAEKAYGVDARVLLVTIACESGPDRNHPSGRSLKSPRTELKYPGRTGEMDFGDGARDAIDWSTSKGMHSSHGIMQTLIGTAHGVAPHLFAGLPPEKFREVLWDPVKSIECGARYMRSFPAAHRFNPVALRFHYGAGGVYLDKRNQWGARMYMAAGKPAEVGIILRFIAYWNDLMSLSGSVSV